MRFVIDLDSLELIESTTDRRRVSMVETKRGDGTPFEVIFVRSGVAEELAGSSVLTFGAKENGSYDGAAVVLDSDFTLSGTGATAKYTGTPSLNTTELNDLFLIDADDSNDPAYIDLMGEFTWQVGSGAPTSIRTFILRVHNDVIRGDEVGPVSISGGSVANKKIDVAGSLYATAGTGTPVTFSDMSAFAVSTPSGRASYKDVTESYTLGWNESDRWVLDAGSASWYSLDDVDSPELCTTWVANSPAHGTPVVTVQTAATAGALGKMKVEDGLLSVVSAVAVDNTPIWQQATLTRF